jgi:WD40 repeat protein
VECNTGEVISYIQTPTPRKGVKWSPDGTKLANFIEGPGVLIWDPLTSKATGLLAEDEWQVTAFDWSPDITKIAIGNTANQIQIWTVASEQHVLTFDAGPLYSVKWTPDDRLLTVGADDTARIFNAITGSAITTFPINSNSSLILGVSWSPERPRPSFSEQIAKMGDDRVDMA